MDSSEIGNLARSEIFKTTGKELLFTGLNSICLTTNFEEICLFEDELSDHGTSSLNVKIRVMPTSFFVLQRFFLRVDDVVVRVYDTRIYHESQNNYIIREYTEKESLVKDLKCSPRVLTEPNEVANFLEIKHSEFHKLEFPE